MILLLVVVIDLIILLMVILVNILNLYVDVVKDGVLLLMLLMMIFNEVVFVSFLLDIIILYVKDIGVLGIFIL